MSKVYPYGYIFQSSTNLIDFFGNYDGVSFKIPAFMDTVILHGFVGSIAVGDMFIEKNSDKKYSIEIGVEREIVAEPGDSFKFIVENGLVFNHLYGYQIGFRYANRGGDIEISESSIELESSSSYSSS